MLKSSTAAAIWMARNGRTKEEIRSYIEKRYGYDLHRTWEQIHPVYCWDSSCQGTVPEATKIPNICLPEGFWKYL